MLQSVGLIKCVDFKDNIGGIDMSGRLAYGPIDVVYTWVNGSDPRWLAKKAHYLELYSREAAALGPQRRRRLDDTYAHYAMDGFVGDGYFGDDSRPVYYGDHYGSSGYNDGYDGYDGYGSYGSYGGSNYGQEEDGAPT